VGLTKIKELNFDTILTTSTKFNIPIYLPPAPTIQTHYNIV
jgi:hypothetical protein